jgi:HD-GYP domain-containing protein (c-di-GMP phosphodiesterase class II)/DNA-binding CsgD family transcriptional regulator
MEPASNYQVLHEDRLEQVALAFADFADLKYPGALGHSRRVAELAERIARRMALPRREGATIRLAGLLHDIGLVAVPSATLAKPREHLTQADWERMRLHPYHAQRILARVPALAETVPLVAAHHERYDGRGYPQGTPSGTLPIGARILAVADRFDELSHDHSGPALAAEAALSEVVADAGRGLCPEVCRALSGELGAAMVERAAAIAPTWPAGLTDREVEILRLLARGCSRRRIATELVLSEHTVRHHLEHIYDKIGVDTRVAAALFAVEHHLLK